MILLISKLLYISNWLQVSDKTALSCSAALHPSVFNGGKLGNMLSLYVLAINTTHFVNPY